jgi:Mg2+ and Co2+ transporter CorA
LVTDLGNTQSSHAFEELRAGPITWLYSERPLPDDLARIGAGHGFDPVHLAECTGAPTYPRVDNHGRYLFAVFHFPVHTTDPGARAIGALCAFVTPDVLLTVHGGALRTLARAFYESRDDTQRREALLSGGTMSLLARLVDQTTTASGSTIEALRSETRELSGLILGPAEEGSAEAARDPEAVVGLHRLRQQAAEASRVLDSQWRLIDSLAEVQPGNAGRSAVVWRTASARMATLAARAQALVGELDGLLLAIGALNAQQTATHSRLLVLLVGTLLPILVILAVFAANIKDVPLVGEPRGFETVLALAGTCGLAGLYLLRRRL